MVVWTSANQCFLCLMVLGMQYQLLSGRIWVMLIAELLLLVVVLCVFGTFHMLLSRAASMRNTYSIICSEFASRGFVVAAVEHADGTACCTEVRCYWDDAQGWLFRCNRIGR